jgi:hypothetical protein
LLDLNRARAYIVDLAQRNNITLYNNVVEAVLATVSLVQEFSSTPIHVQEAQELASTLVTKQKESGLENPEDTVAAAMVQKVGDRVKAQCTGWSKAYYGTVTLVNEDGTYAMEFEDGEVVKRVTSAQIKKEGEEEVVVQYVVGLKVRAKFAGKGHFYPAT